MQLSGLLALIRETAPYRELLARLNTSSGAAPAALGVIRSARPYVLAALAQDWGRAVIYLTARVDRAYNTAEQLPVWSPAARIARFSEPAPLFYERSAWGEAPIRSRIDALAALTGDGAWASNAPSSAPVVVTSARGLMARTMPVTHFHQGQMVLKPNQRATIDKLLDQWVRLGYESAGIVTEPGKFSRRGGILDVFPLATDRPVRIEFFGDEIDSIRTFDPSSQRSTGRIDRVIIPPAREALPERGALAADALNGWFKTVQAADAGDMTSPAADQAPLTSGAAFPFLEFYLPYLYAEPVSLLDYAPDDALIVIEDAAELRDTVTEIEKSSAAARDERIASNLIPPDYPAPFLTWEQISTSLEQRRVVVLGHGAGESDDHEALRALISPETRFGGQLKHLLNHMRTLRTANDRVIAVTAQAARLTDIWKEQEASVVARTETISDAPDVGSVTFVDGTLQEGWRLRLGDGDAHLFTDAEIFGWSRPEPRRRKTARRAKTPEQSYADLRDGDYVVHVDYGVGRFAGMRRRTLEGVEREYLLIEFGGTDTLFVPIHQTDRLTRYVGPDDKPPSLSKLGQPDWARIKSKARKAVEEEANELLELYARRASAPGHAFSVDSPWQHEMEASFPYVETEDQLKAVRAVKADMEKSMPMDRLICGDVGYGKTEVALRAAFKAVMDGKQVGILVPTTILAQQHYETFTRRLAPFPIKVDLLSRFRTKEQQRGALDALARGEVEIMIGTHRLIQDDVVFKDLGLVIIDEEQRFGVKHKEFFKNLRAQVDVLTLTATPIPRTLYMGLAGVRDISMIQTAPEDRLPVITHVGVFDERLVRAAVLREMERGGQVFVVHNRVSSIDGLRERFEQIVPEARIVVGHGQMDERLLESVMMAFGNGEYDILMATAIIESGLDIPNANTLIVDRADWFGLAQLYQIRGRVGRSSQQAYAFFFHPATNKLTEDARARLETLTEYTDLGSGYQIAMRDLELRGAGDILSTRQTGHVAAIGLHLYTQMLARAVATMKGERENGTARSSATAPNISDSTVLLDLPMPAYLPTDWIPEIALRLQIYRRIGGLSNVGEVDAMRDELMDRFGALPAAVEGLLYQIRVKLLAESASATAILHRDGKLEIRLPYLVEANREALARQLGDDVRVTRTAVELNIAAAPENWRDRLTDILTHFAYSVRETAGL
ncbi:MAG: transcription-repair coupling factor [bacterium]|nr:transcription-repair coupling factor [bacterium]